MANEPEYTRRLADETRAFVASHEHRFKLALLVVATLTLIFLLVAALKENVLPEWRLYQLQYADILDEKADDEWGRKLAADFTPEVRQIVVPELDTVDRCVSCHTGIDDPRMTLVKNPFRLHPGDYLEHHEASRFGCTICHRGQGRALTFEDAKAVGHHWNYPLLPPDLTQSGCGVCHAADEIADRGGDRYALGQRLYVEKGCAACHKLHGRGGSLGPALDREGMKVNEELTLRHLNGPRTLPQFLWEHFQDPQRVVPGSQMPPPQLTNRENLALTTYMLSLQDRDLPESYVSAGKHRELYQQANPPALSGAELFDRYCAACHDTGRYGRYHPFFDKFMPAAGGATFARIASREYIEQNIRRGRPGTLMPAWGEGAGGLSAEEIARLTDHLLAGREQPDGEAADVIARTWDPTVQYRGDAGRGAAIFQRHCTGCHGGGGAGWLAPALDNPVFQETATDGFIYATIAVGRRDTAMPAFIGPAGSGLAAQDIPDLIAHIRSLQAGQADLTEEPHPTGRGEQ